MYARYVAKMHKSEPFLIDVIDLGIDVTPLIKDCAQIVEHYKNTTAGKDFTKPFSIELTHNPGYEEKSGELVNYEEIHNQQYFDRDNPAALRDIYRDTSLGGLIEKLPFPFSIIRISVLPPNTIIGMHTDKACHAQIALDTNEDCFVAARTGETKHVPADGRLYIISTTLPHTAFNASEQERSHLSISIFDEDYVKALKGGFSDKTAH